MLILIGGKVALPYDFTYGILGFFAAIITFATVRLNIRFSYYFFVLLKNSDNLFKSKGINTPDNKRYRNHLKLMYLNLLLPIGVAIFFINPLIESLVVPDYLDVSVWSLLRIVLVFFTISLRLFTFREEL